MVNLRKPVNLRKSDATVAAGVKSGDRLRFDRYVTWLLSPTGALIGAPISGRKVSSR